MKKNFQLVSKQNYIIFFFYIFISFLLFLCVLNELPKLVYGDEKYFLRQVDYLINYGWIKSLEQGSPVLNSFPVLVLIKTGIHPLISGRLVSLFSIAPILLAQFYIARRIFRMNSLLSHLVVIFSLGLLVGMIWSYLYYADIFFSAFIIWTLILIWEMTSNWNSTLRAILPGTLLALSTLIRPLTLLYLPGIFFALVIMIVFFTDPTQRKQASFSCVLFFAVFLSVFFLVKAPGLISKGQIILENKTQKKGMTWTQLNYLSKIRHEQGTLSKDKKKVTWEELSDYLEKHGDTSLPKGIIEAVFWNPAFTAKNFLKKLFIDLNYVFLRRTGAFYLFPLIAILIGLKDRLLSREMVFYLTIIIFYVFVYNGITLRTEWRILILPILLTVTVGMAILQNLSKQGKVLFRPLLLLQVLFLIGTLSLDVSHILGFR